MRVQIDGTAVVTSDGLEQQEIEDSDVRCLDEREPVVIESDGPVQIEISHEGTAERIV